MQAITQRGKRKPMCKYTALEAKPAMLECVYWNNCSLMRSHSFCWHIVQSIKATFFFCFNKTSISIYFHKFNSIWTLNRPKHTHTFKGNWMKVRRRNKYQVVSAFLCLCMCILLKILLFPSPHLVHVRSCWSVFLMKGRTKRNEEVLSNLKNHHFKLTHFILKFFSCSLLFGFSSK